MSVDVKEYPAFSSLSPTFSPLGENSLIILVASMRFFSWNLPHLLHFAGKMHKPASSVAPNRISTDVLSSNGMSITGNQEVHC